ncbi:MAG TPA: hypothetical protein PK852_02610 [Mesotoga prima]|uniref:hypothetical protein n=1 Tax=Mesotoga prima TaxID=1184387 RepID=UPI002B640270|nr:hypothetical protein [Mesotoga prima]HPE52987.1 hypothetical protein [Mesotoga prima]
MTPKEIAFVILAAGWLLLPLDFFILRREIERTNKRIDLFAALMDEATQLISVETEKKVAQKKAYERLTDPDAIAEDMEKGARIREMRDAGRTTLPREDAGPPAKVHTLKFNMNRKR